jgi:hypothetical protein
MQRKLLGIISVLLNVTVKLLIIYSVLVKKLRKKMGTKCSSASAIIDFKKAYDSVTTEVLFNILIEFDIPMKMLRLIKICLFETYSGSE